MAERSKARVCGRWLTDSAVSNSAGGMDVCLLRVLCVCQVRDICDGPTTRPDESYRLWCVTVRDIETLNDEASVARVRPLCRRNIYIYI